MSLFGDLLSKFSSSEESESGESFPVEFNGNFVSATVSLTSKEMEQFEKRAERRFLPHTDESSIKGRIRNCKTTKELEEVSMSYDLCGYANFNGIVLEAAKELMLCIAEMIYTYPKVRSHLDYAGSAQELGPTLGRIKEDGLAKRLGLDFLGQKARTQCADFLSKEFAATFPRHASTPEVACFIDAFSLCQGIVLDEEEFGSPMRLARLKYMWEANESSGFHPKGCASLSSIVYHEFGHVVDHLIGFAFSGKFVNYYKNLSVEDRRTGVSEYACTNLEEFVAEAFSEYYCSPSPREIASDVGDMIDELYEEKQRKGLI